MRPERIYGKRGTRGHSEKQNEKGFGVDFTLSVSLDTVPEAIKDNVEVAL